MFHDSASSRWARRVRGVSLIEVMVVVSILGILAAMAVPNLLPIRDTTKLSAGTEQVAGLLDDARRRAIAGGRCYRVRMPTSTQVVLEQRNSSDCVHITLDGWEAPVRTVNLADVRVALDTLPSGSDLIFRPNGRLRGDGDIDSTDDGARVRVTLQNSSARTGTVTVTPLGRICRTVVAGAAPTFSAPGSCL